MTPEPALLDLPVIQKYLNDPGYNIDALSRVYLELLVAEVARLRRELSACKADLAQANANLRACEPFVPLVLECRECSRQAAFDTMPELEAAGWSDPELNPTSLWNWLANCPEHQATAARPSPGATHDT